jgi:hypothetical protein
VVVDATDSRAVAGASLFSIESSSRMRPSRASRKVGKGARQRRVLTWLNRLLRPQITLRISVRSVTTFAIFFNLRQWYEEVLPDEVAEPRLEVDGVGP